MLPEMDGAFEDPASIHCLGVTVVATWADLLTADPWIEGALRPGDSGFFGHGFPFLWVLISSFAALQRAPLRGLPVL